MSERDVMLEKAHEWLDDNCLAKRVKQYDACRLADFALEQIQAERKRIAADMQSLFTDNSHDPMQTYDEFWKYLAKLEAK